MERTIGLDEAIDNGWPMEALITGHFPVNVVGRSLLMYRRIDVIAEKISLIVFQRTVTVTFLVGEMNCPRKRLALSIALQTIGAADRGRFDGGLRFCRFNLCGSA